MLRQQVLTHWNNLKQIITNDQQYQWGKLLQKVGLVSLVPHLTLEQTVQEIKSQHQSQQEQIKRSAVESWEIRNLIRQELLLEDNDSDEKIITQIQSLKAHLKKGFEPEIEEFD